jgi:O-antigen ligase
MLFYAYAVMSVAWSDYQGPSIKRWIRAAGDVIMVVVILSEDDPKEAFERVLRRCAIVLIPLSFLFIRFYGYIGINYTPDGRRMWTGVTTNKNSLGMLCAFMGMMLVWRMSKSRGLSLSVCVDLMLLALALYLLRGSQSATSQVVFVSGVTILLMARIAKGNSKRLKRMVIVTLVVLLLAQGIMVTLFSSSLSDLLYSATQRDSSFTGRTLLWQELFKIGMKNFILGSGYGSFWLGRHIEDQVGFRVITAHNGYLEVFLELGIIGLILLLFLIIHSLQQAMTFLDEDYSLAILRLGFLSMVIFHNFTESTMGGGTNLLWFLFLLSSVILAKRPSPRISADQNP